MSKLLNGCYRCGDVVFNPAGATQSVWSEYCCAVFIPWDGPADF
jgi:hypothetical protein